MFILHTFRITSWFYIIFNTFMSSLCLRLYFMLFYIRNAFISCARILFSFLALHMVQSLYTLFTFFITHHVWGSKYPKVTKDGLISTSWFMNQIKSSNDFYPFSHTANFIFGGVNNHIAHHLFPHISHYHYPKVNKVLYQLLLENNITPNQTTYFGGVLSHLRLLKKRGI